MDIHAGGTCHNGRWSSPALVAAVVVPVLKL